jgi:hypothetical protein
LMPLPMTIASASSVISLTPDRFALPVLPIMRR